MAKLYTTQEAADKIGMTRSSLYGWVKKGIAKPTMSTHGMCQRVHFNMKEIKRLKKAKQEGIARWGF